MLWLQKIPLFVVLMGLCSIAMYAPMFFAIRIENWLIARTFFYHGTFLLILTGLVGIATLNYSPLNTTRSYLLTVIGAFIALPLLLALPVKSLVGSVTLFQAYFEMVSCLTTTGATLFADPSSIADPLHLWRALVGWIGGFTMLVVAFAIFAPLNLGGFEVYSSGQGYGYGSRGGQITQAGGSDRLFHFGSKIAPVYVTLTAVLAVTLVMSGERFFVAVCHAMAVLSTSGISPNGGIVTAHSGFLGEVLMAMFLIFAVSRHSFMLDPDGRSWYYLKHDKEINLMLICVIVVPLFLFVRHFTGAIEVEAQQDAQAAFSSLWGGFFTVLSFLTTTGFESQYWQAAQNWSGLATPSLIFMGLAVMGGGVATTAGGVKLLRVYALYKHGVREVGRLSHPNSVAGSGKRARQIRREGAYIAWIFLMLFLISIAVIMLLLSLTGVGFDNALIFSISALSTTGPLVNIASDNSISYLEVSDLAKGILAAAMVLGRLEALAVIALLNPDYWR